MTDATCRTTLTDASAVRRVAPAGENDGADEPSRAVLGPGSHCTVPGVPGLGAHSSSGGERRDADTIERGHSPSNPRDSDGTYLSGQTGGRTARPSGSLDKVDLDGRAAPPPGRSSARTTGEVDVREDVDAVVLGRGRGRSKKQNVATIPSGLASGG